MTAHAAQFDTILATVDGTRGALTLNRPDKLNPLSSHTLHEIELAARWFDEHHDVKVVVVSGAGRAFSAGADLSAFSTAAPMEDRQVGWRMARAMDEMRAVTVGRLHGWCVGGGLVVAAGCDLRIAADTARFSIPEVDLGIPLAWGGIPRLVREIGPALTKELVMTCRPFDAHEAKAAGFVNRVVPEAELDAAVEELVQQLLQKPTLALLETKAHVNAVTESMVGTGRSWADADGLYAGLRDDEGRASAQAYVQRLQGKG
ncbi:MAG: enoyl-CoA hydratase/isomerase family protein [Actinobacteria bacterium]|nr:enoyl-CoA hydratase/isomerase family protein [Actinomycetota bacterium]